MPPTVTTGLPVSGREASVWEEASGAGTAAPPSAGTVTGVPGALEMAGDTVWGPGEGTAVVLVAGTKGSGAGGTEAVSPPANTAASLSFNLRKRGGLSCLGGRAGRGRRGLSLLPGAAPSLNLLPSYLGGRRSLSGWSYLEDTDSVSSGLKVSMGLEGH